MPSNGGDIGGNYSIVALYADRIQQIKDVLAGELGVAAYSIDTVLYTRNGSAGDDETTAMGKILISFSPNVLEATEDPEAGYEVWAGAVVEDGVAKVDDRGMKWPIMYNSWKGADLTGSSTIVL
jgi:hypothetical protein